MSDEYNDCKIYLSKWFEALDRHQQPPATLMTKVFKTRTSEDEIAFPAARIILDHPWNHPHRQKITLVFNSDAIIVIVIVISPWKSLLFVWIISYCYNLSQKFHICTQLNSASATITDRVPPDFGSGLGNLTSTIPALETILCAVLRTLLCLISKSRISIKLIWSP